MTERAALQTLVIQANPVPDPVATAKHLDAYRSLLALIDQRSGAMDHDTEQAETPPDTPPPPKRSRAPVWAFALAFIVVLLAVGVAALVMVEDEDEEVVDEPITTTTLAAPQSTTTPPTTAAVNGGDAEPVSFVSGLGTLTWTKVVEEDPLRDSVIFNPEFSYLSCDWWANCWASGDGLSWRPVEGLPDHGNAVLIRGYGNTRPMALASPLFDTRSDWPTWGDWNSAAINAALHQDAAAVFALEDGRWVEVGSVGPLPEAVDIFWPRALPRAAGGEYALEMDLVSELPLVEVYGGFDKPACNHSRCQGKPATATWNAAADVLRIGHPFGRGVVARLEIAVSGNTATFQDADSGDVAFELVGNATVPIGSIVEDIKEGSSGVWTAPFGSDFEFHPPPFSRLRSIYAVPDGSGYVAYDRLTVWTSQDAIRWRGPFDLPFSPPEGGWLLIRSGSDVIYALVGSPEDRLPSEFWVSTDGVAWTQGATPPGDVQATEFGFVATATSDARKTSGEWRTSARFWVSTDGHSWIEVEGPPGSKLTPRQPQAWARGVGSNIYWGQGWRASSDLWLGRFEP